MCRMNLHTVKSRFLRTDCGVNELVDYQLDFIRRHIVRLDLLISSV